MLRVGLEDLALQILILDLGEPSDFLGRAMNPPTGLAMRNSLKLLEELGAVECQWESSAPSSKKDDTAKNCSSLSVSTELTALGFHLATLPVDPRVGKMIIYGALFGCVEPALTIAASMSSRSPFVSPFENRDAANEARQQFATEGSDHLTVLTAFNEWKNIRLNEGDRAARDFLRDSFLSRMTLFQMDESRKQYAKLLVDIGFLPRGFRLTGKEHGANSNAKNLGLVKAVLAAGLYPNIIVAPQAIVNGTSKQAANGIAFKSRNKGDVHLHPCTIMFTAKRLDSRYCCFHEIVKTTKMYIRDCTTVSPFALVLFGGALRVYPDQGVASVDNWLKFRIGPKPATLVKFLRSQMENMLLQKIIDPQDTAADHPEGKALIESVSTLLRIEGQTSAPSFQRTVKPEATRPRQEVGQEHSREENGGGRQQNGRGRGRGRGSRGGGRSQGGQGRGGGRKGRG
jgi:HrpA-like RNA helicase